MVKKFKIVTLLTRTLFFILAVGTIVYFCPNNTKYPYEFEAGKPWQYSLLTADFDFPIYKDSSTIRREKESVLDKKVLYFNDTVIQKESIKRAILNNLHAYSQTGGTDSIAIADKYMLGKYTAACMEYIDSELDDIYKGKVLSDTDFEMTSSSASGYITVLTKTNNINLEKKCNKSDILSISQAADKIERERPAFIHASWIKIMNLGSNLKPSVVYNPSITEKILNDELQNISLSSGMVQAGERIIDKGDIVTNEKMQILKSHRKETLSRIKVDDKFAYSNIIGQTLIVGCLIGFFFTFSYVFRKRYYLSNRYFILSLIMIVTDTVTTSLITQHTDPSLVYIIPYALIPMIISTFYDTRTALFTHITVVLLASFIVSAPLEFVLLQLPAGMITIYIAEDIYNRSQLIKAAIAVVITYFFIYSSCCLMAGMDFIEGDYRMYIWFILNGVLLLFANPFIYVIEKLFNYTSSVTLLELSNTNNKILKQLSEEAPGTFQHVLQVANLSSDIAMELKANALLARTGALYHDIGKIKNAAFFTENHHIGVNPHSQLSPKQSATIIIDHVKYGVELARKKHLPQCVIDIIHTHHGKGVAKYFYNTWINEHPGSEADIKAFSYEGPNPSTMEQGIVMICDAVEAASRSLPEYTDDSINALVDKIVDGILSEHYLDDTPIQLKQIGKIKEILKEKLKNIYHTRIAYPDVKK